MATQLKKFTDAYATLTVATYEPLILRWVSQWGLGTLATDMALRLPKTELLADRPLPTAVLLSSVNPREATLARRFLPEGQSAPAHPARSARPLGTAMAAAPANRLAADHRLRWRLLTASGHIMIGPHHSR